MLVDKKQRQEALEIKNKLIKAPSGSGKTGLLINYYLLVLSKVESLSQVQAMTFTNKAGNEMRERISLSLSRVKNGFIPSNDYERENYDLAKAALENSDKWGWGLDLNPSALQICTIDSFCKRILSDRMVRSEDSLVSTHVSNDPFSIYRVAAKNTLDMFSDEKYGASIRKLYSHFASKVNRVEQLLVDMLEKRDRWIPIIFSNRGGSRSKLESERADFLDALYREQYKRVLFYQTEIRDTLSELNPMNESMIDFKANGLTGVMSSDVDKIRAIANILLTKKGEAKSKFNKNDGVPNGFTSIQKKGITEKLRNLAINLAGDLVDLQSLPKPEFQESEWELLEAMFEVMPILMANLRLAFQKSNTVDFTEIALTALNALDSDGTTVTDGAIYKSQTLKHILIDEFQDTNDIQTMMVKMLVENWSPNDGRSLFMVGDAMQSLYGFRGANVNGFIKAQSGIGGIDIETLDLSTNFRSVSGVVDWVNEVFAKSFPQKDDLMHGACKYNSSVSVKVGMDEKPVEVYGFESDTEGETEAKFVAAQIKALQEKDPMASIAVLGRTRNALIPTITALEKENKVNFESVDLKRIDKEKLPNLIIMLARVLIDEYDRVAWYELFVSGFCGLTSQQINSFISNVNVSPLDVNTDVLDEIGLGREEKEATLRFLGEMTIVYTSLEFTNMADVLLQLWYTLNGPSLCLTQVDSVNVEIVISMFAESKIKDITREFLDRELQYLYAKPSPKVDVSSTPVQFMTIHKAKGLEFSYVFVVGCNRQGNRSKAELVVWAQLETEDSISVLACSEEAGIKRDGVSYSQHLMALKAKREQEELVRLAYVAVTRAIKKCVLTGGVKIDKDGVLTKAKAGSVFSTIFDAIKNQIEVVSCVADEKKTKLVTPEIALIHAPNVCTLPSINVLAAHKEKEQIALTRNLTAWSVNRARVEGLVIHSLIERINKDGIENWNAARVKQWSNVMLSMIKELGLPKDLLISSVLNINIRMAQLFDCPTFLSLAGKHYIDDVELAVTLKKGPKLLNLQIDKGFVDHSGSVHLVDWKSAICSSDEVIFVKMQRAKYHEKMRQYASAYGDIRGVNDVNAQLYLTDINTLAKCG